MLRCSVAFLALWALSFVETSRFSVRSRDATLGASSAAKSTVDENPAEDDGAALNERETDQSVDSSNRAGGNPLSFPHEKPDEENGAVLTELETDQRIDARNGAGWNPFRWLRRKWLAWKIKRAFPENSDAEIKQVVDMTLRFEDEERAAMRPNAKSTVAQEEKPAEDDVAVLTQSETDQMIDSRKGAAGNPLRWLTSKWNAEAWNPLRWLRRRWLAWKIKRSVPEYSDAKIKEVVDMTLMLEDKRRKRRNAKSTIAQDEKPAEEDVAVLRSFPQYSDAEIKEMVDMMLMMEDEERAAKQRNAKSTVAQDEKAAEDDGAVLTEHETDQMVDSSLPGFGNPIRWARSKLLAAKMKRLHPEYSDDFIKQMVDISLTVEDSKSGTMLMERESDQLVDSSNRAVPNPAKWV